MEFRIADTLTGSLARLTAEEKAVKTTAFDVQMDSSNWGRSVYEKEFKV